jgi:hypothetical protein
MLRISQVTTVKGRREHVQKHLNRWLNSGIDELVVVDYACPQSTAVYLTEQARRDPRITVVKVPEAVTGPFFNLSKARNIGALAARHELFAFVDADCWVTESWMEGVRTKMSTGHTPPELMISNRQACDEQTIYSNELPFSWVRDGQCVISNHSFHELHGYTERHANWGGENYDLYVRAAEFGTRIGSFEGIGMTLCPHADTMRDQHLEHKFGPDNTRQARFSLSLRRLKHLRRLPRATPGHAMGVNRKESLQLRLFRGGRERTWRPGEDDAV